MERTTALLWKAVHMVGALKKWSDEVEYQGARSGHRSFWGVLGVPFKETPVWSGVPFLYGLFVSFSPPVR